jgi:hypothetical protein
MKCFRCQGNKRIMYYDRDTKAITNTECWMCAGTGLSVKGLIESERKANESHLGTVRPGDGKEGRENT